MNSFKTSCYYLVIFIISSCASNKNTGVLPTIKIVKKSLPTSSKIVVGATLNYDELNTKKEELFLKDFQYLTPANAAKQSRIHPKPNEWNWNEIEKFIAFANKHDLLVRLHGPISPQASKWIKADNRTSIELETNLIEFTTAFAKRFNHEPSVKWMDVVNETILPDGSWFGPKPGTDKWENPWLNMGLDENGFPYYIVKAFEIATKHAPNIELVYNQNAGMEKPMWDKLKETVLYLRSKGCRVDGIGWQGHLLLGAKRSDFVDNVDETMKDLANLIDWAHQNNLAFHVTELDYLVKDPSIMDSERVIQAEVYQKIVNVLLEKSKNGTVTLNLWDVATRYAKDKGDFQSIYDEDFNPTPAYEVIKKAIEAKK